MQLIVLLAFIMGGLAVLFVWPRLAGKQEAKQMEYQIAVLCRPTIEYKDLHVLDRIAAPIGVTIVHVIAPDHIAAKEQALDEYHSTYPIKVLEHFSISAFIQEMWPTDEKDKAQVKMLANAEVEEYYDARNSIS